MFPFLYQSNQLTIGSYGVLLAIAYLTGRHFYIKRLNQSCTQKINTEWLIILLLVFGVLGAKLMFAIKNPEEASLFNFSSLLSGSGFSSQGAILGAVVVTIVFAKLSKIRLDILLDNAAAPAILAYTIARLGCFLAGDDCYGIESSVPWAMAFPEGIESTNNTVHPVPLYEAGYSILIFFMLEKLRQINPVPYLQFFALLALWGTCRFLVEFISTNPKIALGMSGSQIGALLMFLFGTAFLAKVYSSQTKKSQV